MANDKEKAAITSAMVNPTNTLTSKEQEILRTKVIEVMSAFENRIKKYNKLSDHLANAKPQVEDAARELLIGHLDQEKRIPVPTLHKMGASAADKLHDFIKQNQAQAQKEKLHKQTAKEGMSEVLTEHAQRKRP